MKFPTLLLITLVSLLVSVHAFEFERISEFNIAATYSGLTEPLLQYNGLIYTIDSRSLHIYDDTGSELVEILNYPIPGCLNKIDHIGNIFYIASNFEIEKIYRLDLSEPTNPIVTDIIEITSGSKSFFVYDNYLFVNDIKYSGLTEVKIYQNEPFELIRTMDSPNRNVLFNHFNDNIAYCFEDYNIELYDISDINNITLINNQDTYFGYVQDLYFMDENIMILVNGSSSTILVYDISDFDNWSLISETEVYVNNSMFNNDRLFTIWGTGIIVYEFDENYIPQTIFDYSVDFLITSIIEYNNFLYVVEYDGDLIKFNLANDSIQYLYEGNNKERIIDSFIHEDQIFLLNYYSMIQQWDISNPYSPFFVTTYNEEIIIYNAHKHDNQISIGCFDLNEGCGKTKVFEINENNELFEIYELPLNIDSRFIVPGGNNYFFRCNQTRFERYHLEGDDLILETAVQIPDVAGTSGDKIIINGNKAVVLNFDRVLFLDNIWSADNIELITVMETHIDDYDQAYFVDNFVLCGSNYQGPSNYIYKQMDDGQYIPYGFPQFDLGTIAFDYDNQYYFFNKSVAFEGEYCEIYDASDLEHNNFDLLASTQGWSNCIDMYITNYEGFNYLVYVEETSVSIYRYESSVNTDDQILTTNYPMTIYPNPFNPETKISFNVPQSATVLLEIFNLKGQKIKTITDSYLEKGEYEVTWNGTDTSMNQVSSGIYYITMKLDGKSISNKKCILMK